jgi:hypothetical protein
MNTAPRSCPAQQAARHGLHTPVVLTQCQALGWALHGRGLLHGHVRGSGAARTLRSRPSTSSHDRVAVRLTFRGTHAGEFLGFPATGRAIAYVSHEFYRIADGLIAEEWICSDTATLHRQLS